MKSLRIPAEHDVADMQNHPEFLAKAGVKAETAPKPPQFPPYDAKALICEAIEELFGERCPDFEPECVTCAAWAEWDRLNSEPVADGPSHFWILSSEVSSLTTRAEAEQQALGSGVACIIGRIVSEVKLTPCLEVVL